MRWTPDAELATAKKPRVSMKCINNGKSMQRVKDDEAQKLDKQGWYVVTKNDYKRWLARQQQAEGPNERINQ
jgi:hypothetical protein